MRMNIIESIKLRIKLWYIRRLFFRIYWHYLKKRKVETPSDYALYEINRISDFLRDTSFKKLSSSSEQKYKEEQQE